MDANSVGVRNKIGLHFPEVQFSWFWSTVKCLKGCFMEFVIAKTNKLTPPLPQFIKIGKIVFGKIASGFK